MSGKNECDATVVIGALLVFTLPLTLLIPGFSVWNVVPKVQVTRCLIFSQNLTWTQLNAAVVTLLVIFFGLYLEIRKRKLDDMVEKVLSACQETDALMVVEGQRQTAVAKACMKLLDSSIDYYENLALLREDLRNREKAKKQFPPEIEPSQITM